MPLVPLVLAACATVAFPRPGQVLPAVSRTYAIGAVSADVTNLVVAGKCVRPYRTGAWSAVVPVTDGSNVLSVVWQSADGAGTNEIAFSVTPLVKKYVKLAYAKDRPEPVRAKPPAGTLLYLDPGHGGADTGAVSPHGHFEKEANLSLALAAAARLRARGYRVKLTRETDVALELYERARAAHAEHAEAFVSIHHNAPAVDADAATRYSATYSWNALGDALARAIEGRLAASHGAGFPSKGVLRANFAVTRSPEIPSCLVESDFISSPEGEEAIFDEAVLAARAEAIAAGVDDWCRARHQSASLR